MKRDDLCRDMAKQVSSRLVLLIDLMESREKEKGCNHVNAFSEATTFGLFHATSCHASQRNQNNISDDTISYFHNSTKRVDIGLIQIK